MNRPGAELAALRKQVQKVCKECGASFTGTTRAVFCSTSCRVKNFRKKQGKNERAVTNRQTKPRNT